MCPATSPSHSDMNQHCHVSTDLISFAHRAVFNPKVSSFVALYSTDKESVTDWRCTLDGLSFAAATQGPPWFVNGM